MNFSDYQFKSDSFGIDAIVIGKDFEVASNIVVFGVAQEDSRYALEISSVVPAELDYLTIDETIQRSPGASYEELCLQHSFDSDSYYAEEEQSRLRLLSIDAYPESTGKPSIPVGAGKRKEVSGGGKHRKQRQADQKKTSGVMDEDSFLYHFLIWLLEFIVDVFFWLCWPLPGCCNKFGWRRMFVCDVIALVV